MAGSYGSHNSRSGYATGSAGLASPTGAGSGSASFFFEYAPGWTLVCFDAFLSVGTARDTSPSRVNGNGNHNPGSSISTTNFEKPYGPDSKSSVEQ